jgi:hypothetical protein
MPRFLKRLIALGVGLLIPVLLGECALRIMAPAGGWAGVPSVEERAAEIGPRQGGVKRALALGDSFTEYKDNTGDNWFRYALASSGDGVEGFNLSQLGTGVEHYRINLNDYGPAAKPDVVLVGLYLGNDILDYELVLRKQARGLEIPKISTRGHKRTGLAATLKRSSALVAVAARTLRRARQSESYLDANLRHAVEIYGVPAEEIARRRSAANAEMVKLAEAEAINPWDLAWGIAAPERYRELFLLEGEFAPRAFDVFLEGVAGLDASIKALGAEPLFVLIPVMSQVDESYDAYLKDVGVDLEGDFDGDTPLWTKLRAQLDERGVRYVDALPALRAAKGEGTLFLPNDTHLSDLGQQVTARPVAEALRPLLEAR